MVSSAQSTPYPTVRFSGRREDAAVGGLILGAMSLLISYNLGYHHGRQSNGPQPPSRVTKVLPSANPPKTDMVEFKNRK